MGYRDDGYFYPGSLPISPNDLRGAKASLGGTENPPFIFPDKSIRFLEAQSDLQRRFNTVQDTIARGKYTIHRGYIRNLEQPQFGEIPLSRCNFQFNPQEIRQSVAMREDMYLPLLQTVEQLAQPVGAVVNFTFDLMFDRSHELSQGNLKYDQRITGSADRLENVGRPGGTDPLNPNPEKDVADIGVLADLRVLYAVIGQGFSKEMIEFQKERFRLRQKYDAKNTSDSSTTDETSETDTSSTSATNQVDEASMDKILNANYGNWGLLMPNPVRVMFSSLFMLDGFITGTNVDFLKFNTNMVPLMCRVTMNMSAMYIGFARADTFLTKTFQDAADSLEEERRQNEATKNEVLNALAKTGSHFVLSTAWDNEPDRFLDILNPEPSATWDSSVWLAEYPLPLWAMVISNGSAYNMPDHPTHGRAMFLGFPQIKPREGSSTATNEQTGESRETGRDIDFILQLYEQGLSFTISYSWDISIYGSKAPDNPLSEAAANNLKNTKAYKNTPPGSLCVLVGKYTGTETASSDNQWGKGASGDGADKNKVRRRSRRGNQEVSNEAYNQAYAIHNGFPSSSVKNAFYIVETSMSFSVTYGVGNSEELLITRSWLDVKQGTSNLRYKTIINWQNPEADGLGQIPALDLVNGTFS